MLNNFDWNTSRGLQQGIENGAQGLAAGISAMGANLKKLKAFRQMAVDGMDMDPDQVDHMTAEQIQGHMQGVAWQNTQQEHEAKMKEILAQAADRQNTIDEAEALGKIAPNISAWQQDHPGEQIDPTSMFGMFAGAKVSPRVQGAIMSKLLPGMIGNDGGPMNFTEDPVSGFRFATKGKIVQPSGVNPGKAAGVQMIPQHDEEGNLLGFSQVDARGHAIFRPAKGGATMKQATDENDNPIPGFYVDGEGKVHDTRSMIEKNFSGKSSNATNPPAPEDAKQRKANTIYQTPKGALKWTGTGWITP